MSRSVILTGTNDTTNYGSVAVVMHKTDTGLVALDGTPSDFNGVALPQSLTQAWCDAQGLSTKVGSSTVLRTLAGPNVIVVVSNGLTTSEDEWRRLGAAVTRSAPKSSAVIVLTSSAATASTVQAITEGAILASYDFKSTDEAPPIGITVLGEVDPAVRDSLAKAVSNGALVADGTNWAKRLIDMPAMDLSPKVFGNLVRERFEGLDHMKVEIWKESKINDEKFGGLIGVNLGSAQPPRVVIAEYNPPTATGAHIALVGKGVTFDSGGLSLKTGEGMMTMKTDMSGAAVVMATIAAAAELNLPIRVTAIAPLTENMTGEKALRPGDILKIRNGMTVEVLNTDAEGRLILADALSWAAEKNPDLIIDVATLTGAQAVALGDEIGGMYSTSDEVAAQLEAAANATGETMWRLPLFDNYESHIDSDVADIKNIGKAGRAGSISAALFLRRFTAGKPWVHLDIAGPSRSDSSRGYFQRGATAFGARTLLQYLINRSR